MQTAENLIQATHVKAVRALKPLKRLVTGEGSMMRLFRRISADALAGNVEALRRTHSVLLVTMPPIWQGRYEKQLQLILLCRFCLASGKQRTATYHELLPLLRDESHELTREILLFLSSIMG